MTRDEMAEQVGFQADWREERAREYPQDARRNLEAASALRKLSECISAMPDTEFERLYSSRYILADEFSQYRALEVEREILSDINFCLTDAREFFASIFDQADAPGAT